MMRTTAMLRAGIAILALCAGAPGVAQTLPGSGPAPGPAAGDGPTGPVESAPAVPRQSRAAVLPYVEVGQVLDADLDGGDVLTYTELAAGVDASIDTARVSGQVSARYEHRFAETDRLGDDDILSGLARVDGRVTRNLTLEAGAIGTRARSDIRGAAPGVLVGNVGNIAQVYSLYAGPSYSGDAGIVALNANYRVGYTKVDAPTYSGLQAGLPRLDYYGHSWGQVATASAGVAPRALLPVGLTASAAYDREDASQLDQRYEGYYVRGDALYPVSPYVALTAGVGYERIETSQHDVLIGPDGAPALDGSGRFETDEASPRRIAYLTDGVYYDAGVVWRPNRRTSIEAHAGKRYGSFSFTGTATYQASRGVSAAVGVYDGVETFGRQLRQGLSNLPTSFVEARDAFGQRFNGCTFSTRGTTPGGCLNDVFQSISTASYRARGVDGVLTVQRGLSTYGLGIGYANRELEAPDVPSGIVVSGLNDESYFAQAYYARALSPVSGINANAFFNYYDSDLIGSRDIVSVGAIGTYYRNFGRLGATGSLGIYSFKVGDLDAALSLQALLAARYSF